MLIFSRRKLIAGTGISLAGAAAATASPGAIRTAAALAPGAGDVVTVRIDTNSAQSPMFQIQSAINALPQDADGYGSGTIHFCADPQVFDLAEQIILLKKRNTHLIFEPGISFRANARLNYIVNIADVEDCSIRGLSIDAANQLLQTDEDGEVSGGAITFMQNTAGFEMDSCVFANTNGPDGIFVDKVDAEGQPVLDNEGERISIGAPPPDGVRLGGAPSDRIKIHNCDFSQVRTAVDASSTSNLTVEHNTFADLLDMVPKDGVAQFSGRIDGGSFVTLKGQCSVVMIASNRNPDGRFCFGADEIGGSPILTSPALLRLEPGAVVNHPFITPVPEGGNVDIPEECKLGPDTIDPDSLPQHFDVTVRDNFFRGREGAWRDNVPNGTNGDVITIKNVNTFIVERNTVDKFGEFGIVVSHGSRNGAVIDNFVKFGDGCGVAIGAQNFVNESGFQENPRVDGIRVWSNLIHACGFDRGRDLGRYRALPSKSLSHNYANAVSSLRVWNSRDVFLTANSITEYRSSGIWVKKTFDASAPQALNKVCGLRIDSANTISPYRSFDNRKPFRESFSAPPPIEGNESGGENDFEPWTGPSRLEDVGDDGVQVVRDDTVSGFAASRYVGPEAFDPFRFRKEAAEPEFTQQERDQREFLLDSSCFRQDGRVDLFVKNFDHCAAHTYRLEVDATGQDLEVKEATVPPRGEYKLTTTFRKDGPAVIRVYKDDVVVERLTKSMTIACGSGGADELSDPDEEPQI